LAAIYDRPVRLLFRDMVQELNLGPDDIVTRERANAWFKEKYPKIKPATISAHLIKLSTNAPSRVHYNVNPNGEDDLFFQLDSGHYRRYNPQTDPAPIYEKGEVPTPPPPGGGEEEDAVANPSEFAYEKDLQSFLAKHLSLIEPGLRLYEEEGITGIEYPVGGRFIDILAVDRNKNLVVIELKVSRAYDRVIGQVMRYMGWIKKNLADERQAVRGIIIGRDLSDDLLLAAALVPTIELYEYTLSVALKRIPA
jgi:endonuclease